MKYRWNPSRIRNAGAAIVAGAVVLLFSICAPLGVGQTEGKAGAAPAAPEGQPVREIDDPHTGNRWLLFRDPGRPGGPGRMVLSGRTNEAEDELPMPEMPSGLAAQPHASRPFVIRIGDPVVVEENSPKVEARFDAVALGDASAGAALSVRLGLGGKVVRAVALGEGRAAFTQSAGTPR